VCNCVHSLVKLRVPGPPESGPDTLPTVSWNTRFLWQEGARDDLGHSTIPVLRGRGRTPSAREAGRASAQAPKLRPHPPLAVGMQASQ